MNGVLPFHGKRVIQGLKSRVDGVEKCRMEGKQFPSNSSQFKTPNFQMKELTPEEKQTYRKWLANGDLRHIAESFGDDYVTRAATYVGRKYVDSARNYAIERTSGFISFKPAFLFPRNSRTLSKSLPKRPFVFLDRDGRE